MPIHTPHTPPTYPYTPLHIQTILKYSFLSRQYACIFRLVCKMVFSCAILHVCGNPFWFWFYFLFFKANFASHCTKKLTIYEVCKCSLFGTFYTQNTQQNSYSSISYLLGKVTTHWLPLWRCSLVPDTMITDRTHTLWSIHYHGASRNLSTRHLVGNCMVTTWEDTRYPLHIVTV